MLTAAGLIVAVVFTAAPLGCIGGDAMIVAHDVTLQLTCTGETFQPTWFVNGTVVVTAGHCYTPITPVVDGNELIYTLQIDGNRTCGAMNILCKAFRRGQLLIIHNISLTFQVLLHPPENIHTNIHFNLTIGWTPPYSSMNNESDIIHVDPHITQYTVYITDNYTGNMIVKRNVTETQFTTNIQQADDLCPMYQVSAWNAGGEGELSKPVQESTPQVPRNVIVEGTVTTNVIHILINNVDVVCTSRIPEFFLITLMNTAGNVLNETRRHQPGQPVANFTISLPQNVDMCSLHVRISAGNSAGMSAPSEAVEVVCSGSTTDSATAASISTGSTATSTGSGSEGNSQQGNKKNNTTWIVIIIGVIAAVGVMLIVAVGIMCCLKHKSKNSKVKHSDQTDNNYTESPSLGGLDKPPEVVYATTESIPIAMAPEIQTQRSYSPTSSPSTVSKRSDDLLLPPSPLVPASRPNLVYTQVNVQQTQVPPPANDDHVQYAQIKQQDKI